MLVQVFKDVNPNAPSHSTSESNTYTALQYKPEHLPHSPTPSAKYLDSAIHPPYCRTHLPQIGSSSKSISSYGCRSTTMESIEIPLPPAMILTMASFSIVNPTLIKLCDGFSINQPCSIKNSSFFISICSYR